jgi:hypothetical protein
VATVKSVPPMTFSGPVRSIQGRRALRLGHRSSTLPQECLGGVNRNNAPPAD